MRNDSYEKDIYWNDVQPVYCGEYYMLMILMKEDRYGVWFMTRNPKQPIEFATIALFNADDSTLVTGTITDPEWQFQCHQDCRGQLLYTGEFHGL